MSTLPVEVTATEPPTPCVQVLGYNLYVGPAHVACYMAVLVCLGPGPQIRAIYGTPSPSPNPPLPLVPDGVSPVARVDLLPASPIVFANNITPLDAEGRPVQPSTLDRR
jgi:hypothetical protein